MQRDEPATLISDIDVLITMDDARRVIYGGWVLITGNTIQEIGDRRHPRPDADQTFNASGHIVLPGLINTHHHFFQTLLRAVPSMQDKSLWYWLQDLYAPMGSMTDEMNEVSTRLALTELLLSGCTTAQDHSYICVNDMSFETQIAVASDMGMRFHLSRGSMTLGQSQGSIPPDFVIEDEDAVLANCEHLVKTFHQPQRGGMTRIEFAPCSLFSVTPAFLEESASLARALGVGMHTHCYESQEEEDFCVQTYGLRPVAFADAHGWSGPDTWYAHAVRHNDEEIELMAKTGTGVAHCPTSNARLASGIAPVRGYLDHGVRVGLGVDGSASNDGSHMLAEARHALLMQRLRYGADALTASEALELATLGGARVLGRDDVGALKPGMMADLVGFNLNQVEYAGAQHDPVAALVFCQPTIASFSFINGKQIVGDGRVLGLDMEGLIRHHNQLSAKLISLSEKITGRDLTSHVWKQAWKSPI